MDTNAQDHRDRKRHLPATENKPLVTGPPTSIASLQTMTPHANPPAEQRFVSDKPYVGPIHSDFNDANDGNAAEAHGNYDGNASDELNDGDEDEHGQLMHQQHDRMNDFCDYDGYAYENARQQPFNGQRLSASAPMFRPPNSAEVITGNRILDMC